MQSRLKPGLNLKKRAAHFFKCAEVSDVVVRELHKFEDNRGWLAEIFRQDELLEKYYPVMAYISTTFPGMQRGPHEHRDQADLFCFIGASNFKLRLWDNRPASETYRNMMTLFIGEYNPKVVLVPEGVVHCYRNIGEIPGLVINCPNRLYMGEGRRVEIDEIRHEDAPGTIYRMDD